MTSNSPTEPEASLEEKLARCREALRELGSVVVALSGGVDSSLALGLAVEALGQERVLAATAVSGIFPQRERKLAGQVAKQLGVGLVEIETPQLTDARFTANPPDRCYHCKRMILTRIRKLAEEKGYAGVVTGAHTGDDEDYRPGVRAEEQMGIHRPLREARLTKEEIRMVSRRMKLPTWNAPSAACLATRIPYGEEVTAEKLARIEAGEEALRAMGFSQLRLRDHGAIARIELPSEEVATAIEMREQIIRAIKSLGYTYVTMDLQGFRSGSMNETLG